LRFLFFCLASAGTTTLDDQVDAQPLDSRALEAAVNEKGHDGAIQAPVE
jgi:hypothetical protein